MNKKLTTKSIDALPPATGKRYEVRDILLPGLHLRVSATGGKVFGVSRRINGRMKRIRIGAYPLVSLSDAREKARDILREIELGQYVERPVDTVEAAPRLTLGEVVPRFIELYAMMLVHHASKTGDQRGASRLEDFLDTTIKLEKSKTVADTNACFDLSFTKTRGIRPDPDHMTLVLEENEDGIREWQHSAVHTITPKDHTLYAIYQGPSGDSRKSFAKQKDLVDVLNLQAGAISKHLTFLRKDELVEQKALKVTMRGKTRLTNVFPDETFH